MSAWEATQRSLDEAAEEQWNRTPVEERPFPSLDAMRRHMRATVWREDRAEAFANMARVARAAKR